MHGASSLPCPTNLCFLAFRVHGDMQSSDGAILTKKVFFRKSGHLLSIISLWCTRDSSGFWVFRQAQAPKSLVCEFCISGRGYKTTPKWGIKPPPTPFLAIFDPWGGFMPPGGGFIPPFAGVGLSPQRGGFIPRFGHWGGFITPLGWFYPPFLVILSPYWPGGGGVGRSQCEPGNSVPEDRQTDAQCTLQPALV